MFRTHLNNLYEKWLSIIRPLIYLPNITPVKEFFSSEIFPWAVLYGIRRKQALPMGYILFLMYLLISAFYVLNQGFRLLVPARALFALINATLIFFVIIKASQLEFDSLKKIFMWVFLINISLGVIQYFGLFPPFLTPFMRLLIDRFTDEPHGGGRGVAALFAEPSYASLAIHYYFAYFMFLYKINFRSILGILSFVLIVLFDLFIIRSITGLVMVIVYFLSLQTLKFIVRGFIFSLVVSLVIIYVANQAAEKPRAIEFLYDLIYNQEYQDPMPFLLNESGFRIISVWAAYVYGFFHPLGSGIGGWGPASLEAMDNIGVPATEIGFFASYSGGEFEGVRPTSFVADLFLEAGWIGFLFFILAFSRYMFSKTLFNDVSSRPVLVMFFFNLFVMGTVGDPLPFIFLALAYRSHFDPNNNSLA
ncbi:MAG: hypothetical protein RIT05_816 [Bacteroidota bacterium]